MVRRTVVSSPALVALAAPVLVLLIWVFAKNQPPPTVDEPPTAEILSPAEGTVLAT